MRGRSKAAGIATMMVAAACSTPAMGEPIVDTFGPGVGFDQQSFTSAASAFVDRGRLTSLRLGVRFQVGAADRRLTSVTLPISTVNFAGLNALRVRIAADAGGLPGATLEVLGQQVSVPTFGNIAPSVFRSQTRPVLNAGASYWIVTEPIVAPPIGPMLVIEAYAWHVSTGTMELLASQETRANELPTGPWTAGASPDTLALRVDADPVTPLCAADFNRSGSLSVQDLFDFLSAYFSGC